MRNVVLCKTVAATLVVFFTACAAGSGALNTGDSAASSAPVVRVVRSQGETTERLSSIPPGETPPATVTMTPTVFALRPPTSTTTPTPSATRTVTVTATQTVTPTPSPRGGADVLGAVTAFQSVERYRASITGPAEIIQEIDGPDKMRVFISGNQSAELIVAYGVVYQRSGGRWFRQPSASPDVINRIDRFIPPLANLRRTYQPIGVVRTRAGRCMDWDVMNNAPNEPISICLGVVDHFPYRLRFPGNMTVEFYDFNQQIVVPEPVSS